MEPPAKRDPTAKWFFYGKVSDPELVEGELTYQNPPKSEGRRWRMTGNKVFSIIKRRL